MKTVLTRLAIVMIAFLVVIEIIERASVPRPESWNERMTLLTFALLAGGLLWSVHPAFEKWRAKIVLRGALFGVLAAMSIVTWNVYCGQVRPNLGWYEEPHWVSKFPAFQEQQRERIRQALW